VLKAIMISKPQSYLASKRSRHQRSDGDCALSLGSPVASRNGHVGRTVRPPWIRQPPDLYRRAGFAFYSCVFVSIRGPTLCEMCSSEIAF
jgi:hypothetical protein